MTDMPQMVAIYNGMGGGAAAAIAWSRVRARRRPLVRRHHAGYAAKCPDRCCSLYRSRAAHAKLQDR